MSTPIAETISTKQLVPIVPIEVKPTDTIGTTGTGTKYNNSYECDELYEQLPDLVNRQYRGWFCKQFYRLGKDKVLKLAAVARTDGLNAPRYFAKLLKEAR